MAKFDIVELRGDTIIDGPFFRLFDGTVGTVKGSREYDAGVVGRRWS
jgi:hypothetical protein